MPGKETWVWRLKRGLYGLVQAGRTWNEELNTHMEGVGFTATEKDPAVYVKSTWDQEDFAAGGSWVDDFIGIGSRKELPRVCLLEWRSRMMAPNMLRLQALVLERRPCADGRV